MSTADDFMKALETEGRVELDRLKSLSSVNRTLAQAALRDLATLSVQALQGKDVSAEKAIAVATVQNLDAAARSAVATSFERVVGVACRGLGELARGLLKV